jgi:hypothetical protein
MINILGIEITVSAAIGVLFANLIQHEVIDHKK